MKNNNKSFIIFLIINIITSILIFIPIGIIYEKDRHTCSWTNCEYKGDLILKHQCEEGTDCYYFEKTHWNNPNMTPKQVENFVFSR